MSETFRRAGEVFTAPVDDMLLMMSVDAGKYFGLKGAGPRIWELLENPTTIDALVERLTAEYEVSPDMCAEQVSAFLGSLRQRKLLVDAG